MFFTVLTYLVIGLLAVFGLFYIVLEARFFRALGTVRVGNSDVEPAPKVSILISARNEAVGIRETLDSVLAQDYRGEWDVWVADDRSDDETPAILAEYVAKNPRLHVLTIKEIPEGVSPKKHALSLLIEACEWFGVERTLKLCRGMFAFGLFVSSLATMTVGFHVPAVMLMVVWFVNGFAQGSGSPCCVVSLARWWPNRSRGTFYGIWSCSNNLGEAIAYVVTSVIMVRVGLAWGADMAWRSGFWGAATFGFIGVALISLFMRDSPQSEGLPPVAEWEGEIKGEEAKKNATDVKRGQKIALTSWAVWMVALSGGFFCMSRYAIIDWGIFFLEVKKGYATETAAWIITLNSIVGAVSSGLSGIISDRVFKGSRNELALIGDGALADDAGSHAVRLDRRARDGLLRTRGGRAPDVPRRVDGGRSRAARRGRRGARHRRDGELLRRGHPERRVGLPRGARRGDGQGDAPRPHLLERLHARLPVRVLDRHGAALRPLRPLRVEGPSSPVKTRVFGSRGAVVLV